MPGAVTLLSEVFGFNSFRPGQEEIVDAVANGNNVLAIMPTGGNRYVFNCLRLCEMA